MTIKPLGVGLIGFPDFDDAVARHRMPVAIEQAAATGERVYL